MEGYIDELIELRKLSRANRDYSKSDEIRNYLDSKYVFVYDTKDGQEVYHLNKDYFKRKKEDMTNRQFFEIKNRTNINANSNFDAWLHTQNERIKNGTWYC